MSSRLVKKGMKITMSEIKLLTGKNLALKYYIYFRRGNESAKWMQLSMLSLNKKMTPLVLCLLAIRPVGAGGTLAPPDYGRSVNPISTSKGRLCPPHYNWQPWIFRPSYGPGYMSVYCPEMLLAINPTLLSAFRQVLRA